MCTVRNKDTHNFLTGRRDDLGADGCAGDVSDSCLVGGVRPQHLHILERIDFSGKRVLEFGFGRGEAMKYALEYGALHYEGVDFASAAHELATNLLQKYNISIPLLHQEDAILFIKKIASRLKDPSEKFDVVLMLDFIEHVQRSEVSTVFRLLKNVLDKNAVIAINTPDFLVDNDIFVDGVNYKNKDLADVICETQEMHCNKYTRTTLQSFMSFHGYVSISEAHFFVLATNETFFPLKGYLQAWNDAKEQGAPILAYGDDVLEMSPPEHTSEPPVQIFTEGRMAGLSIFLTEHYKQVFSHGNYDDELFASFLEQSSDASIVFDLGGFMGVSSLLFSRCIKEHGRVYCFEPNLYNLNRIRKNLSLNQVEAQKIRVLPFAVGNKRENTTFLLSRVIDDGRSSTSQLRNAHCTLPQSKLYELGFFEQEVQVVRLDDFVAESGIVPDIIKVDIEGAEHFFIEGAYETLSRYHPILFIELHSPFCAIKCATLLEQLGYSMRVLHEEEDKRIMIVCNHQKDAHSSDMLQLEHKIFKNRLDESQCLNNKLVRAITLQKESIAELSTYKTLYADLHSENILTHTELSAAQADLSAAQAELSATQAELSVTQAELSAIQATCAEMQTSLVDAQRVLSNPMIRGQRKLWRMLKFWK